MPNLPPANESEVRPNSSTDASGPQSSLANPHRRKFLGQMGTISAAMAVGTMASPLLKPIR
jgi:hypothetical protein